MKYKTLSIAGFDGSGGAGIQADLKTFSALGCYGMTVLTALPVQNTTGVSAIYDIPIKCIEEQIISIFDDIKTEAVKIGMLHTSEIIKLVASKLKAYTAKNIVIDPVMVAKSGHKLLADEAIQVLKEHLIPLATVLTPNIPEAEELTGYKIRDEQAMEKTAKMLLEMGPKAVFLKGGHFHGNLARDILVCANDIRWFEAERIKTRNTHGTGCTLSAAITALLAQSYSINEAISMAKSYITNAIKAGSGEYIGQGRGPVHHFYHLWNGNDHLLHSFTESLWIDNMLLFEKTIALPFNQELALGTLDMGKFKYYIIQDYLYLQHYSKILIALAAKAPSKEETEFWLESSKNIIEGEMQVHKYYLETFKSPIGQDCVNERAPITDYYINFLYSMAFGEPYEIGVAAVLPCFWIYSEVGKALFKLSKKGNVYQRWIDNYASSAFLEATKKAIQVTELQAAFASTSTKKKMRYAYKQSAQLEHMFWKDVYEGNMEFASFSCV